MCVGQQLEDSSQASSANAARTTVGQLHVFEVKRGALIHVKQAGQTACVNNCPHVAAEDADGSARADSERCAAKGVSDGGCQVERDAVTRNRQEAGTKLSDG